MMGAAAAATRQLLLSIFNDKFYVVSFLWWSNKFQNCKKKKNKNLALEWCWESTSYPSPNQIIYEILKLGSCARGHTHTYTLTGIKFETNNKFRLRRIQKKKKKPLILWVCAVHVVRACVFLLKTFKFMDLWNECINLWYVLLFGSFLSACNALWTRMSL